MCTFGIFLCKFGCHGHARSSLENSDSILQFADPQNPNIRWKISRFLSQNWNQCNFGLLLSKFGCYGNYLGSIKNSGSIFEFTNSVLATRPIHAKNSPFYAHNMRKNSPFYAHNWNLCHFGLFLSAFCCHGNSLGSFEILNSMFEVADTGNLTIQAKNSSNSCRELISVKVCLIFA